MNTATLVVIVAGVVLVMVPACCILVGAAALLIRHNFQQSKWGGIATLSMCLGTALLLVASIVGVVAASRGCQP